MIDYIKEIWSGKRDSNSLWAIKCKYMHGIMRLSGLLDRIHLHQIVKVSTKFATHKHPSTPGKLTIKLTMLAVMLAGCSTAPERPQDPKGMYCASKYRKGLTFGECVLWVPVDVNH